MELAGIRTANANLLEKLENQKRECWNAKPVGGIWEHCHQNTEGTFRWIFGKTNHKNLFQDFGTHCRKKYNFEKKVEETYDMNLRDKNKSEGRNKKTDRVKQTVSDKANNLYQCPEREMWRKQGNWGWNSALERVLERSGRPKDRNTKPRWNRTGSDDSRQRPDVIVHPLDDKAYNNWYRSIVNCLRASFAGQDTEEQIRHQKSISTHSCTCKGVEWEELSEGWGSIYPILQLMFPSIEASFGGTCMIANSLPDAWGQKPWLQAQLRCHTPGTHFLQVSARQGKSNPKCPGNSPTETTLHDKFLALWMTCQNQNQPGGILASGQVTMLKKNGDRVEI